MTTNGKSSLYNVRLWLWLDGADSGAHRIVEKTVRAENAAHAKGLALGNLTEDERRDVCGHCPSECRARRADLALLDAVNR